MKHSPYLARTQRSEAEVLSNRMVTVSLSIDELWNIRSALENKAVEDRKSEFYFNNPPVHVRGARRDPARVAEMKQAAEATEALRDRIGDICDENRP